MGNVCCHTSSALSDEKEEEARKAAALDDVETAVRAEQADGKHPLFNVKVIETILLENHENDDEEDARPLRRAEGRKGTGYVTKAQVEAAAAQSVSFTDGADGQTDGAAAPPIVIQPAPKRKGRKPTGMVTKDQLKKVVDETEDSD
mmetsp:Transcript_5594/g.13131  ORF Transcript_5594/g.13131 Transcript_5594/m.13131 type:complete len:146 (+) Transcript_5594:272-709(+)|eukprot:CAMPEP_0206449256 /NCGR_PEP_ID=MMETSP0324_2-20121206/17981_1 /ASSEMBLY_ACC=CAM_ASM_000836 /TAXON_ID=2866 /ORGANISM="Crypthecodinium cohnii, Strain Seligo" /LENGTH=145 /DNA_ID=CAMNT_0053918599 /DNA_START=271 /DNA_END=708 /DNA_ORIENTATION=-